MKRHLTFFMTLILLVITVNAVTAQSAATHNPEARTAAVTLSNTIVSVNDSLPDYRRLKIQLRKQGALKGWGWFNAVWGGAWFGTAAVLTLMSSENRMLGIVPAAIGAGTCFLGIRRIKRSNRNIKDIKRQMILAASAGGVTVVYRF